MRECRIKRQHVKRSNRIQVAYPMRYAAFLFSWIIWTLSKMANSSVSKVHVVSLISLKVKRDPLAWNLMEVIELTKDLSTSTLEQIL